MKQHQQKHIQHVSFVRAARQAKANARRKLWQAESQADAQLRQAEARISAAALSLDGLEFGEQS